MVRRIRGGILRNAGLSVAVCRREGLAPLGTAARPHPASGTPRGCRCAKGCAPAG